MARKKKEDSKAVVGWLVEHTDTSGKIRAQTFDNEQDALDVYHDLKQRNPSGYVAMNKSVKRFLLS